MAEEDKKITALTAVVDIVDSDIIPLVEDPGGTPVTKKIPAVAFLNDSMHRNAVFNGNFDTWQRATTTTIAAGGVNAADKWYRYVDIAGGTAAIETLSRQTLTLGSIPGSVYCLRLAADGATANPGASARYSTYNKIENANSRLCGDGKTLTLSFLARSDIFNKRLGFHIDQDYGTGGTPSTYENLVGDNVTLTSDWQLFTHTFTTNTLSGKTFGTNNNENVRLAFYTVWGSNYRARLNSETDENWSEAGYVEIAQVQLVNGSVALPLAVKTVGDDLRNCQRTCHAITTVSVTEAIGFGSAASTTVAYIPIYLPVEMRKTPVLELGTAADWQLDDGVNSPIDVTAIAIDDLGFSSKKIAVLKVTVASGLTANRPYFLVGDGSAGRILALSSEV
jgi:hypothetical protein